jgi:hypothetical protein
MDSSWSDTRADDCNEPFYVVCTESEELYKMNLVITVIAHVAGSR